MEFAKAFCVTKFKASDCWWNNWKKRYNLSISINFEYFYKVFEHIFCSRMQGTCIPSPSRGRSRAAATSKIEHFVIIVNGWKLKAVNYYHKALHLGCCSSPRSASAIIKINFFASYYNFVKITICCMVNFIWINKEYNLW